MESLETAETSKKSSRFKINRQYIPLKLIYLFFIGGVSCTTTYRSVFAKHLGMSTRQTGVLWALDRTISIFVPPLIGIITDKTRRPKTILIALFLGGAITISLMYFVPPEDVICVSRNATNVTVDLICSPNDIDEYGITFWLLILLVFLASFSSVGIYPVVETSVLEVLGSKNRHKYGTQRLWASVGFGSAALIIGYLKDISAENVDSNSGNNREYLSMFIGVMICWSSAAIVSSKIPIKSAVRPDIKLKDIKIFLKSIRACAFLGVVFVFGFDNAILEIFLFWLAEIKFEFPSFVFGASTFIGSFLDIPFCLSSGYLIRRFGHTSLLCVGMAVMSVRVTLAALVTNPWQMIASESLRCITWGLMFVVLCSYTSKISPKGLEASSMGITQGFLFGVSYSVGALLGGVIFHSMGGDFLFLISGCATFATTVAFAMFSFCKKRKPAARSSDSESCVTKGLMNEEQNNTSSAFNGAARSRNFISDMSKET